MLKKILLISCLLTICTEISIAQKRQAIDRTKQATTVQKDKTGTGSSSNASNNTTVRSDKSTSNQNSTPSHFTISSNSANFESTGGTKTFTVSSSKSWNINVGTVSWGHLEINGNSLVLRVDPNTTTSERNDYFILKSGIDIIKVNIKQQKKITLDISSAELNYSCSGGSQILTVTASDSWQIGTKPNSWGHLSINGSQITLAVDANTATTSRTDYFTIKSGNVEKRINITQSGIPQTTNNAIIQSAKVINDIDIDKEKGLSVQMTFSIKDMKGKDGLVACYFYDASGNALKNTNDRYHTFGSPNYVYSGINIKPGYDNSTFTDLEVKIPYTELHLPDYSNQTLRVDIIIWDNSSSVAKELGRKEGIIFTCPPTSSQQTISKSLVTPRSHTFSHYGSSKKFELNTSKPWTVSKLPYWCRLYTKDNNSFTLRTTINDSRYTRNGEFEVSSGDETQKVNISQYRMDWDDYDQVFVIAEVGDVIDDSHYGIAYYGLSYGKTWGKHGFYTKLMSNFNFNSSNTDEWGFSAQRHSITAGYVCRLLNWAWIRVGAGYGQYKVSYDSYAFENYGPIDIDAGLMLKLGGRKGGLMLSPSVTTTMFKQVELRVGIGWSFATY